MKRKIEEVELSDSSESDNDSTSTYEPSLIETNSEHESEESEYEEEHPEKKFRSPYDNFCIYKIVSKDENDNNIYIGSTIDFERRKEQHRKSVDNKNGIQFYTLLYRYIRNNGGWDNFVMEKIIECSVSDKRSGFILETEYIINYKATLNTVFPITDFEDRMNLI